METVYKDYVIEPYMKNPALVTVVYCGDEIVFDTVDEAKQFIDEISE